MKFLNSLTGSVNSLTDSVKAKQNSLTDSVKAKLRSDRSRIQPDAEGSSYQRPLRLGSFHFDGPTFPDLFHEANDMLNLSNLIYVLAEVRDLARGGALDDSTMSSRVLELPLPLNALAKILLSEADLLKEKLDDGKHAAALGALESLLGRQEAVARAALAEVAKKDASHAENGVLCWVTNWCVGSGSTSDNGAVDGKDLGSSMIAAMGDLKSNEELVYAVGVNPLEERITVIFRGSVTKSDFVTDSRIAFIQAPDPRRFNGGAESDDYGVDVGVHQGFYEYLLGEKDGRPSKYAEIMKHVEMLLAETPARGNYKLYITGHSLGGALATLFGFYAAASSLFPLPVTVVSVASPRVGNIAFARAFVELESQGRIRHLRIANHKDPVTLNPSVSAKRALALSAKAVSPLGYLALVVTGNGEGGEEEIYYHTGIKMKLLKNACPESNRRCELSYSGATILAGANKPADNDMDADDLADIEQAKNMKKSSRAPELPMVSYHYGDAYSERMASVESDLKGLTLNALYRLKTRVMP